MEIESCAIPFSGSCMCMEPGMGPNADLFCVDRGWGAAWLRWPCDNTIAAGPDTSYPKRGATLEKNV